MIRKIINSIFGNLSRGIFFTIGKYIAFGLLMYLVYLVLKKMNIDIPMTYPMYLR